MSTTCEYFFLKINFEMMRIIWGVGDGVDFKRTIFQVVEDGNKEIQTFLSNLTVFCERLKIYGLFNQVSTLLFDFKYNSLWGLYGF